MNPAGSNSEVRILHLEDTEADHVFLRETLRGNGLPCCFDVVDTRTAFEGALRNAKYQLIISDYSLPSFDGMRALALARQLAPQTPFLFFSGTIGEEVAVSGLQSGAVDYVLKHRPSRLVAAVRRALRDAEEREALRSAQEALRRTEERLRTVMKASNDVVWEWNRKTGALWFSDNFQTVFGHPLPDPSLGLQHWHELIHPDDKLRVISSLAAVLAERGKLWISEYRVRRSDGAYAHVFDRASVLYEDQGEVGQGRGVHRCDRAPGSGREDPRTSRIAR